MGNNKYTELTKRAILRICCLVAERFVCYKRKVVKFFGDIKSEYTGMSNDK